MMQAREKTIILYGAYGYTGKLIAEECRTRGLHVILSGRRETSLIIQSHETGYPFEVVDLSNTLALKKLLQKGCVVIHCGGPFQYTAQTMVEMCLQTKTHYTDISGEYQVFEMLSSYDAMAKDAGITILPGAGFDVVPSDCLAVYLKNKLPSAVRLQLAFMSSGGLSRGTAKTMVEGLGAGSVVRRDGILVHIPLGERTRKVNFGRVTLPCLNIPWGDVSTAWYSTGIPDIEVYTAATASVITAARLSRYFNWLVKARWVKRILLAAIDRKVRGPGKEKLETGKSLLWGKVYDVSGKTRVAAIETLSGYKLTSKTSVVIAENILDGNFKTGFQTPAGAYGADLIMRIENTRRIDLQDE